MSFLVLQCDSATHHVNLTTLPSVHYLDFIYRHRSDNSESFTEHVGNTHAILPASEMTTFEEWVEEYERRKQKRRAGEGSGNSGWNRVSLSKLLMGRL